MGVIIDEFEVVVEQAREQAGEAPLPGENLPPQQLSPQDILDIILRTKERMDRVRAY